MNITTYTNKSGKITIPNVPPIDKGGLISNFGKDSLKFVRNQTFKICNLNKFNPQHLTILKAFIKVFLLTLLRIPVFTFYQKVKGFYLLSSATLSDLPAMFGSIHGRKS
jgi:hypothetical protein